MRIFETDAACFFLYCYFFFTSIGLCLHAHPKPKLKGLYLHIFGNQVELHVFLTHFFQKKKKKKEINMKQMKFWLLHNQMSTAKQMRAATFSKKYVNISFLR